MVAFFWILFELDSEQSRFGLNRGNRTQTNGGEGVAAPLFASFRRFVTTTTQVNIQQRHNNSTRFVTQ